MDHFKESNTFQPGESHETADAVEEWLQESARKKDPFQLEIKEILETKRNLEGVFLGKRRVSLFKNIDDYSKEIGAKDLDFKLRLDHWSTGETRLTIVPGENQEPFVLRQNPQDKTYYWKGIKEQPIQRILLLSNNTPGFAVAPPEKWLRESIKADYKHEAVVRVMDKLTGKSKDYKIVADFTGKPDKMNVKSSVTDVELLNAPPTPIISEPKI